MGDAIYNFQACCIIITNKQNKHHNRHVCNSNEGTKVSFMLKETIYGKSPIFSPVIKSILFWPKYRLRYAYCHMTAIYILAQKSCIYVVLEIGIASIITKDGVFGQHWMNISSFW